MESLLVNALKSRRVSSWVLGIVRSLSLSPFPLNRSRLHQTSPTLRNANEIQSEMLVNTSRAQLRFPTVYLKFTVLRGTFDLFSSFDGVFKSV